MTIKKSTIAGAGNGLFADRFIKKGEIFSYFTGELSYTQKKDCIELEQGLFLQPFKDDAYFANHSILPNSKIEYDTKITSYISVSYNVYLVALENIKAGTEITCFYSKEYHNLLRPKVRTTKNYRVVQYRDIRHPELTKWIDYEIYECGKNWKKVDKEIKNKIVSTINFLNQKGYKTRTVQRTKKC